MTLMIVLLAGLLPMIPAFVLALRQPTVPVTATRRLVAGLSVYHLVLMLMLAGAGTVWLFAPEAVVAAGVLPQEAVANPYAPFAAAISVGLGSLGAAYAVATTGSAAVGAIAEKPEIFGRALIFVGLAEGVAIYGLIIAFIIVGG